MMAGMRHTILTATLLLAACGTTADQTRTAITTLGALAGPARELAVAGCEAERQRLGETSERCRTTLEAFELVQTLQRGAQQALDEGRLEDAKALVEQARAAFQQLLATSPRPGA